MKKHILSSLLITSVSVLNAQYAFTTLDINQVRAGINSNGALFWDYSGPAFEVPADSGRYTIYAGAPWIGGLDAGGQLHVAAQTYSQGGGDFFQGPVMSTSSYSSTTDAQWNQVWKINKTTIDSFLLWYANPSIYPGYTVPSVITTWPGNGDVVAGQAAQLAPYIDQDNDGLYNPSAGDYPCIKGDQAIYIIFNDDRNTHSETFGQKLGVEMHALLYAYSAPGTWLDSTVFLNYTLYNRSTQTYSNVYWGQWTDFEIGYATDDYAGCDVERHTVYGYNATANDGFGPAQAPGMYGANPPAQGMVVLRGPEADAMDGVDNDHDGTVDEVGETWGMTNFMLIDNDFSATGNPQNAIDYYDYMRSYWPDGTTMTYGGTGYGGSIPADYMYPNASDPMGWGTANVPQAPWDQVGFSSVPGDRRTVAACGPFTLAPHESNCLDFAYVFGTSVNDHLASIPRMLENVDSAHAFYAANSPCTCEPNPLGITSASSSVAGIYPNPANESINIICGDNATGSVVEILDVNGKIVKTTTVLSGNSVFVSTQELPAGVYFVRVNKGAKVLTGKFVRQ